LPSFTKRKCVGNELLDMRTEVSLTALMGRETQSLPYRAQASMSLAFFVRAVFAYAPTVYLKNLYIFSELVKDL